jgi:hypothetical protein
MKFLNFFNPKMIKSINDHFFASTKTECEAITLDNLDNKN